jgi:squalene-hopene/tetraprenyl-beta-curcumene cyclase
MARLLSATWPAMLVLCLIVPLTAAEPVTLENFTPPEPNRADEPFRKTFSIEQALHFLDSASLEWQQTWQCFTCHTNVSYLIARPNMSADAPAHREVRKYAEELISLRWEEVQPRFDAEIVAVGAALALNDAATTKKLHPLTRSALDRMWTRQRPEGDWNWPTGCRWPPMESDDHYGVTLAAIGAGAAPDDYAKTPAAVAGLEKIRSYLKQHPPVDLHHRGMVLWAATYVDGLMSDHEKQACLRDLVAAQRPDGGWVFSLLYPWKRADDKEQDLESSDGYGTGFVTFVLRKAGLPADDPTVARGVAWLRSHQRESGRWFTRSLNKDNEHFISHAGSAYAVMALAACGVTPTSDTIAASVDSTPSASASRASSAGASVRLAADAPPLKAYLAEQQRRRRLRIDTLQKRLAEVAADPTKASLLPVLTQQLADLERESPQEVNFDAAYEYAPITDRLGYSRKVRLLEHTADGRSIILVENAALVLGGLGTAAYPPGKFFAVDRPILVGEAREDYVFRGQPKKCYDAILVDVDLKP